jgi:hypothetical protein
MEQALTQAIAARNLIEFWYRGHRRIAEPHILGVSGGVKQLLVYQTGGTSRSGGIPEWRRFDLGEMYQLNVLSWLFPGRRPVPSDKHSSWDWKIAFVA